MAATSIRPGTEGQRLIRSMWADEIKVAPVEEGVIEPDIPRAVNQVGDTMYLRVIPAVTINSIATTSHMSPEALTYESGTVTRAEATPSDRYGMIEVPINLTARLGDPDNDKALAGYRKALKGGLEEAVDAYAGTTLALNVSTIKGPGNFDKAQLLDLKQTLRINAKSHFKNGAMIHVKYHPSQIKYLETIAEIMNAELRGDSENPNVKGFFVKAWGMTFAETANIPFSGGNYWNMAFLPTAFAKGYNMEPTVKPPVELGSVVRYFGYTSVAFGEWFDLDAAIFKSA